MELYFPPGFFQIQRLSYPSYIKVQVKVENRQTVFETTSATVLHELPFQICLKQDNLLHRTQSNTFLVNGFIKCCS